MLKKNDIQVKTKCYCKINLIVTAIAVLMLGLMSEGVSEATRGKRTREYYYYSKDSRCKSVLNDAG